MASNLKNVAILTLVSMLAVPGVSSAAPKINPRLNYVRRQLVLARQNSRQVDALLKDKRIKLFPMRVVKYKKPDWKKIEDKLYSPVLLDEGRNYIKANQKAFDQAEHDYGVDKAALAGLIAIETDFGKNLGGYSVFNMLYSRMMQWPQNSWKRQADEIVALSKYCLRSKLDCFADVKGSYAGAFGLVQFMPSSLLAYGVDGNGDGVIDLYDPADAVPSAANFLKARGWANDQMTALARYYGSSKGYPKIVLTYASLLKK